MEDIFEDRAIGTFKCGLRRREHDADARYPTILGHRRDHNSDGYEGVDDIEMITNGFPDVVAAMGCFHLVPPVE
jgi:hypothetical protein